LETGLKDPGSRAVFRGDQSVATKAVLGWKIETTPVMFIKAMVCEGDAMFRSA
jgi:hypothetical protein